MLLAAIDLDPPLYFLGLSLIPKDLLMISNLTKHEFLALDPFSKKYISWILDAKIYLQVKGLLSTTK